ncbi:GntR family transcriptional regulator [Pseudonocardia sp.]|uniref:GntR family transcriptional regulator n=1 Tax=Pseudonocardia sp. TaxID=60912 RepID=UPI003D0D5FD1
MARGTKARPLDRSNPLPLWAQLQADLLRRLRAGAFEDHFPGEHELVADYQVSRHTVRDAMRRLREDGIVESSRGRGTWLRKQRIEQPLGALYSLFRSVEAQGLEQRSVVRALDIRVDESAAARLDRPADTEFVYLERVRLADGEPLALDRAWLPRAIAGPLVEADFTHSGLYDELANLTGTRLTGGSETITAVVLSAANRRLLKMPTGMAAFEVHRRGCLRNQPVEWRETVVRGDRFCVTARWSPHEGLRMGVSSGLGGRSSG